MKANEAPEKLYFDVNNNLIGLYDSAILGMFSAKNTETSIEYTRTDAFIEKAWDWIEDNMLSSNQQDKSLVYHEQFKNYMKGDKV